jgi:hypothetical protein
MKIANAVHRLPLPIKHWLRRKIGNVASNIVLWAETLPLGGWRTECELARMIENTPKPDHEGFLKRVDELETAWGKHDVVFSRLRQHCRFERFKRSHSYRSIEKKG